MSMNMSSPSNGTTVGDETSPVRAKGSPPIRKHLQMIQDSDTVHVEAYIHVISPARQPVAPTPKPLQSCKQPSVAKAPQTSCVSTPQQEQQQTKVTAKPAVFPEPRQKKRCGFASCKNMIDLTSISRTVMVKQRGRVFCANRPKSRSGKTPAPCGAAASDMLRAFPDPCRHHPMCERTAKHAGKCSTKYNRLLYKTLGIAENVPPPYVGSARHPLAFAPSPNTSASQIKPMSNRPTTMEKKKKKSSSKRRHKATVSGQYTITDGQLNSRDCTPALLSKGNVSDKRFNDLLGQHRKRQQEPTPKRRISFSPEAKARGRKMTVARRSLHDDFKHVDTVLDDESELTLIQQLLSSLASPPTHLLHPTQPEKPEESMMAQYQPLADESQLMVLDEQDVSTLLGTSMESLVNTTVDSLDTIVVSPQKLAHPSTSALTSTTKVPERDFHASNAAFSSPEHCRLSDFEDVSHLLGTNWLPSHSFSSALSQDRPQTATTVLSISGDSPLGRLQIPF
eukprot:m.152357 g.152357  ORF g.152357 m.152357 type:complete len:508 (-) comp14260_c0_seq5:2396-3919(-)